MIPKNIFLIWFGNYVPIYVRRNAQRYSQLNYSFNVQFIHRTIEELEFIKHGYTHNIIDSLILESYNQLKTKKPSRYGQYIHELKKNVSIFNVESAISLSDVLRLELLNKFGGIYVDCDVFQLKPFDSSLLQNKRFVVKVHHTSSFFSSDNFFIGSIPQNKNDYLDMPFLNPSRCKHIVQTIDGWRTNVQYIVNKKNFYNLEFDKIKPAFDSGFYIEHYTTHSN